jgi:hypothetical protein
MTKKDDDLDGQKILASDNLKTGFAFLNPYSEVEPQLDDNTKVLSQIGSTANLFSGL